MEAVNVDFDFCVLHYMTEIVYKDGTVFRDTNFYSYNSLSWQHSKIEPNTFYSTTPLLYSVLTLNNENTDIDKIRITHSLPTDITPENSNSKYTRLLTLWMSMLPESMEEKLMGIAKESDDSVADYESVFPIMRVTKYGVDYGHVG